MCSGDNEAIANPVRLGAAIYKGVPFAWIKNISVDKTVIMWL